jgi:hypothetical protein
MPAERQLPAVTTNRNYPQPVKHLKPLALGTLARTHEGQPGLPRGRSHLPRGDVRASHRERLLHSVIAAASESGYHGVTVADIVRRASSTPPPACSPT